jgi:hypothetical protein
MGLSQAAGKALGKLVRNLRNPRWVAASVAETGTTLLVINPIGKRVKAELKSYLHHHDEDGNQVKIGDVYHCPDGHNYIHANGKTYRYDGNSDSWMNA